MTDAAPIPHVEASRSCPSCHASMRRQAFASRAVTGRGVDLDICFACHGIWFDPFESAQLSPAAILQLFELIRKQEEPPRPLAVTCTCPACHRALSLTHDFERTNRITYFRCAAGHGRFTTFMQFLREKNFVRTLSPSEVNHLRAVVSQVKCSSCGAPVDLSRDMECSYCHAPIAMLDADAVGKTIAELHAAQDARPKAIDPAEALNGLLAGAHDEPPDLVRGAITLIMDAIT
ncbi:MAG TPA: zf-TFIIB domain-containing protein [Usitatibacter sp.]|nr:zf-TFIIB domain-containing protein [Usitatibacter sp.]